MFHRLAVNTSCYSSFASDIKIDQVFWKIIRALVEKGEI